MREPKMVGPNAGYYVSRRSHCRRPISDGAYRGRLGADSGGLSSLSRCLQTAIGTVATVMDPSSCPPLYGQSLRSRARPCVNFRMSVHVVNPTKIIDY